jgi:hypothetical protein
MQSLFMADTAFDEEEFEAYYREVSDGCGCMELWEYLSERRNDWTQPEQRR